MAINSYFVGRVVTMSATLQDISTTPAVPTDGDTVTFKLRLPDRSLVTYVYGVDAALERESTGVYKIEFPTTMEGVHYYRFESTGAAAAAGEGEFVVMESVFV